MIVVNEQIFVACDMIAAPSDTKSHVLLDWLTTDTICLHQTTNNDKRPVTIDSEVKVL